MGTFTSVSLYDRGSTKPVSGRTVRVTSWPEGGPVETDPAVLTTDYYGATPEFMTADPDVHAVRVSAGTAQPRTVFSMEKLAAAEPELPPAETDGDVLTVEAGEWVARSGASGSVSLTPHPSWPWALIANVEGGVPDPDNHAPTVTINTASTVINGLDATLYWSGADVDGNPLTFSVDWGDGQTTNGATSPALHTYATGGTFTATVTASDGQATGQATHDFLAVDPNAPSAYHQAVMADGPIMYWPLDESAPPVVDVVSATAATSAAWPVLGALGIGDGDTCADFYDGGNAPSTTAIDAGAASATNGLTTFTLECLVEPAGNSGSNRYYLDRDDATSNRVFRLSRNSRKFVFSHRAGPTVTTLGEYDAGFVYHLAVVADGTNLSIYVNGTLDNQAASTSALPSGSVDLTIGNGGTGVNYAQAKMAGVAIYDKALSPSQITAHKNAAGIPA